MNDKYKEYSSKPYFRYKERHRFLGHVCSALLVMWMESEKYK